MKTPDLAYCKWLTELGQALKPGTPLRGVPNKQFCRFHHRLQQCEQGSILAVTCLALVVLLFAAATILMSSTSRFPASYQASSWQSARLAAEAGIALAISNLCANHTDPTGASSSWPGWKLTDGTTAASGTNLKYTSTILTTSTTYLATNIVGTSPAPIYTGTNITLGSGSNAYVNVRIDAFWPVDTNHPPWFRIRSMGTVPVSGPVRTSWNNLDIGLRKASLKHVRQSLQDEAPSALWPSWWDTSNGNSNTPTVSRVYEVVACPVTTKLFDKAIKTKNGMTFANSNNYYLDSYNSDNSANHLYPGQPSGNPPAYPTDPKASGYDAKAHKNGDIATNSNADPAIVTNGAPIYGDADTGPTGTVDSESDIKGDDGVKHDFNEDMSPATAPSTAGAHALVGNTVTTDYPVWVINSNPGGITFSGTGNVTLVINADWNLGNNDVRVPPSVHVKIYVNGDIGMNGNGKVNSFYNVKIPSASDSCVPGNLIIYGTAPASSNPSFTSGGTPNVSALFYIPNYDVNWNGGGNGTFNGSIVANSFYLNGGGKSAYHYDEAAAEVGNEDVTRYVMASSCEDNRR